jgi:hypothetical protein
MYLFNFYFIGCDGSLFVVPALSLVDPSAALDHRWRAGDLTELPLTAGVVRPTPSSLVWWHNLDGQHVAVLGSAQGHICFVSLTSGADLGRTGIPEPIEDICLCQDNNLDSVFILVSILLQVIQGCTSPVIIFFSPWLWNSIRFTYICPYQMYIFPIYTFF